MMKSVLLGLAALILVGCQSNGNNYTASSRAWRGSNVNLMLQTMGQPSSVRTGSNGHKFYTYQTLGTAPASMNGAPQVGVNPRTGGTVFSAGNSGIQSARPIIACTIVYETNSAGKIVNVRQSGPNC